MRGYIYLISTLFFLFLILCIFSCRSVQPDDFNVDSQLLEYLKKDLPIGKYIAENKGSLGYIDTLSDFEVRVIRPEIPELFSGLSCLIIQDLETGKCHSACKPIIYHFIFGGNSLPALNPFSGIGETPDTIFYHKDQCSNLIALEAFLNEKYGVKGIPEGFLEDFLNTYFKLNDDIEPVSYEELEKRVKARLKSLDVDTEGKNFVQAYTWELASTLAKIKEAKNVSNLYAQYLYGYGASGIAIRVYRISFSTPKDRVKKPDAGPFQYRIAIDEI